MEQQMFYGVVITFSNNPDSKVHGANMGPIWGRQDPSGPHVGPMNFAIWEHPRPYLALWRQTAAESVIWVRYNIPHFHIDVITYPCLTLTAFLATPPPPPPFSKGDPVQRKLIMNLCWFIAYIWPIK